MLTAAICAAGCGRAEMVRQEELPAAPLAAPPEQVEPARAAETPVVGEPATFAPRTLHIGRSVEGRPLVLELFGTGRRPTFVLGGIHGNEPTSADVAEQLVAHLRRQPADFGGASVAVLARANPDGLARRRRQNAAGVDLNRNFPARNWQPGGQRRSYYGGPSPASEPETRAILRAIEMLRPARIIAIHAIARGKHCNNYDGPAEQIARRMNQANGYPVRPTMGYATPGSLGSWAGVDRAIPIITLELPRDLPGDTCWSDNRDALLTAVRSEAVPGAAVVGK